MRRICFSLLGALACGVSADGFEADGDGANAAQPWLGKHWDAPPSELGTLEQELTVISPFQMHIPAFYGVENSVESFQCPASQADWSATCLVPLDRVLTVKLDPDNCPISWADVLEGELTLIVNRLRSTHGWNISKTTGTPDISVMCDDLTDEDAYGAHGFSSCSTLSLPGADLRRCSKSTIRTDVFTMVDDFPTILEENVVANNLRHEMFHAVGLGHSDISGTLMRGGFDEAYMGSKLWETSAERSNLRGFNPIDTEPCNWLTGDAVGNSCPSSGG